MQTTQNYKPCNPCIIVGVSCAGLIWSEVKQLWDMGLREYVHDMWNVIDFVTNSLYVATVALRIVSHFQVNESPTTDLPSALCSVLYIYLNGLKNVQPNILYHLGLSPPVCGAFMSLVI